MLDLLGTVFGAATGGGVLGIVGGLIRQWLESAQAKAKLNQDLAILKAQHLHEETMRDKDAAILKLEAEGKVKIAQTEGDSTVEASRYAAMGASFAADKATFATGEKARESRWFVLVDVMRGGIRPVLTVVLDLSVILIWAVLMWLLWGELAKLFAARDPLVLQTMVALIVEIVRSVVFLATTATGYWFVAKTQPEKR